MTTLVEAMTGPFASWLGDPFGWRSWFAAFKAMTAVPLDNDEGKLFQACTGRTSEFAEPVSEAYFIVGRRGRKSAAAAMIAVHSAVFVDWSSVLAPGETGRVLIVAVDKGQARLVRNYAEAILRSHPDMAALIASTDAESITLANGISIVCVANSFRSIRGPAVVCAIFDECCFWRSDESAVPDVEVLRAVRPAMLTTRKHGALLIALSSPYARRGLMYEKFRDHHGDNASKILVWKAGTLTMNAAADAAEIEEAYRDDPVAAASEYGAEFRADIAAFLDAELLAALTRSDRRELAPMPGTSYVAFADPSGGRGDAFAFAIAHREADRIVVDLVRARPAPFTPASVVTEFSALAKSYACNTITADRYSAEWAVSAFREHGITLEPSPLGKSGLYTEMLPAFTQGAVELPDDRALLNELAQLERRTVAGGKDRIDHPPRGHDDRANVVAGAIYLCRTPMMEQWDESHFAINYRASGLQYHRPGTDWHDLPLPGETNPAAVSALDKYTDDDINARYAPWRLFY